MNDEIQLKEVLADAIRIDSSDILQEYAYGLETKLMEEDNFPESTFMAILGVIKRKDFRQFKGSWQLLKVFEDNWDLLSDEQRELFLIEIKNAYDHFADWMACFMISEILGRLFCNKRALQVISHLRVSSNDLNRSFLPNGLEQIVTYSSDKNLVDCAVKELVSMKGDPSKRVQEAVSRSLAVLVKRGKVHL